MLYHVKCGNINNRDEEVFYQTWWDSETNEFQNKDETWREQLPNEFIYSISEQKGGTKEKVTPIRIDGEETLTVFRNRKFCEVTDEGIEVINTNSRKITHYFDTVNKEWLEI